NTAARFEAGGGAGTDGGRAEELFAGCEVVVRRRLVNQRVAACPLEPRSVAAGWGDDDRLHVWSSTQTPQASRAVIETALGLPAGTVHLVAPDVGGGFGPKIGLHREDVLVCWLARSLRRPVRWTEGRTENMAAMGHGRAQVQTVTIGGRRDGTILAYRLDVVQDAGAYPRDGAILPELTEAMAAGVYDIPRVHFRARSVVTNTMSTTSYRGAGRPEATAAIERAVDLFAAGAGLDPAEVRRRNLVPAGAFPHTTAVGTTYDTGDYAGALDRVLDAAGYGELRAEQARRRQAGDVVALGVGLSCYVEVTAGLRAGQETARVIVRPDGDVVVLTGTSPHGQGHATAWATIAAERLGIGPERVEVVSGDTDRVPVGGGTSGSRSLQLGGTAVHEACGRLIDAARARAGELLGARPDRVVHDGADGRVSVGGAGGDGPTWADVAGAAGPDGLQAEAVFRAPTPTYPFGAHLAVVEVDTETGQVALRRMVTVDDAGRVLNPLLAEGQRHGGIAQGVGQALWEEMAYDGDGVPLTADLASYAMPTAGDLPAFELVAMETPTPVNPLGAKGIGESGAIGSTPAVQNAVVDALAHLGVDHVDLPCTPERVWQAIVTARDAV
ncbi:MAG: molybdopterin-dependent oxidoreductase, partial [Actinobacteria bacterium]|nr:molybdopterin-dependent oxidoreductase [Actinomycetota bacterium]